MSAAVGGFLQGFLGPIEKRIQEKHEEEIAQKQNLSKIIFPQLIAAYGNRKSPDNPNGTVTDESIAQLEKVAKGLVPKSEWDSFQGIAQKGGGLLGKLAQHFKHNQPQQQQSPGATALPPPVSTGAALAQVQQSTQQRESAQKQQELKDKLAIEGQAKVSTAKAEQEALAPGKLQAAKDTARAQREIESEEFQSKIAEAEKLLGHKFSPEQLQQIALSRVGIKQEAIGSSTEKLEVKGPDGQVQTAFRDPHSGKVYDANHKELDMSKFSVSEKPKQEIRAETKELMRRNELLAKPKRTPEEEMELKAIDEQQTREENKAKLAQQRFNIYASNAAQNSPNQPGTREWAEGLADAVATGRMAYSQMLQSISGQGRGAAAFKRMAEMRLMQVAPDYNFKQAEADYQFSKSPGFQNTVRYMDSIVGSIPLVIQRARELANGKIRLINGLKNLGKDQLNDPKLKRFQTDALLVADEIAKVLQGGGTGNGTSDAKLKQAAKIIETTDSPENIATALADVKQLIGYRRESLTSGTYMEGTEPRTPGSNAVGNPETKEYNGRTYSRSKPTDPWKLVK